MMRKITKNKALSVLSELVTEGESIRNKPHDSSECVTWDNKVKTTIDSIFGEQCLRRYEKEISSQVRVLSRYGDNGPALQQYHYDDVNISISFMRSLIHEIEKFWEDDDEGPSESTNADIQAVIQIIERFHLIVKQLRQRHNSRETLDVDDEYDVQDLFHALLKLYFDDVRAEEWTPSYAGSSSRIDFLIPELSLAIETKMTRKGLANKEAGEQLAIDKDHYRCHSGVKHLICFVYDSEGRIKNPRGFEKDLRQEGPLRTDVYVRP